MLLVTKRLLLAGIGLFGGATLAVAGPYSAHAPLNCPDGHCSIAHATHECAPGECESPAHHQHAQHDHAHHDHAQHHNHSLDCETGCDLHGHPGAAGHQPYRDPMRLPGMLQAENSFGSGSRWSDRMARQPFAQSNDTRSLSREDRYFGHFSNVEPNDARRSTWDDQRAYGENPGRYNTLPYPRDLNRRPPVDSRMPRTLPAQDFDDLMISQPTRW